MCRDRQATVGTYRFLVASDEQVATVLDRDVGEFEQRTLAFGCVDLDAVEQCCTALDVSKRVFDGADTQRKTDLA